MSISLLLELGAEDLPARYVMPLAEALGNGISGGLAKRGVALGLHRILATPRRIAVLIDQVGEAQPEQSIERLGPAVAAATKDGQPTPAALGFARSCGVEFSALGQKDGKLHFAKTSPGKSTAELLPEIFEETLKSMDELVPKRMRWGGGSETFVRPVHWIVALLGGEVVRLHRFGLDSGRVTHGHRFHAPAAISLKSPADYESSLKSARVWVDAATRKDDIRRQIEIEATRLGGNAKISEDLLDEVTALVEWPVVISGRMEDRFMQLPPEVIVATVETNQRYFTVFDSAGKLLPYFITVSNIESRDVAQVIQGNERVVRPRLTDALFFYEQDLKQGFRVYVNELNRLEAITYQKDLGSLLKKVQRVAELTMRIGAALQGRSFAFDPRVVRIAADLCKNDLVTRMVYEFPELQGIMGGYYAEKSGETIEVARAIREHYLPTQQRTPIPSTHEGQIVALADKLDTLAGIFAIGQKPTASKDPYALRRAALGALRICIEGALPLDLAALLKSALDVQPAGKCDEATLKELTEFTFERLRGYYTEQALPAEMFEAVRSLGISAPMDFNERVQALREFWALPEAKNLAAAHKRVRNILRQAGASGGTLNPALFEHDAERALSNALSALDGAAGYAGKLKQLATLRAPVDAFFDAVMVNAENPAVRSNRLALLRQLDLACREVADISCLPG